MTSTVPPGRGIRPKVLALLGAAVLIFAVAIHVRAFWPRWVANRVTAWAVDLPVDLAERRTCRQTLVPILSNAHSMTLILSGPLEGSLSEYKGKDSSFLANGLPSDVLSQEGFRLSWQLFSPEGDVLADGTAAPADLKTWVSRDHFRSERAWWLPRLERGVTYSLIASVDQVDQSANRFHPTVHVNTWYSLKGRLLVGWTATDTVLVVCIGVALIVAAAVRRAHGPTHRPPTSVDPP